MEWLINASIPHARDLLGFIPQFLDPDDDRRAAEQIDDRYSHGGGWRPMPGWELRQDASIKYPGDPALKPIALARLRSETVFVYPHAWVVIVQPDGSFEISRMD